jgi:hypothetical protein
MAVRNSVSSGHYILSTIHADKAASIPMRMYSLLEGDQDIDQYLASIHRYVQIGVYVKGFFSKELNRFQRQIMEVCEFYVNDDNVAKSNVIYRKSMDGTFTLKNPTRHLLDYLNIHGVDLPADTLSLGSANDGDNSSEASYEEKPPPKTPAEGAPAPAAIPAATVSTPAPAPPAAAPPASAGVLPATS